MQDPGKEQIISTGVHWVYSREEWRQFRLWLVRKAGCWPFLLHLLPRFGSVKVPEVLMVPGRLHIGDHVHDLGPGGKKLIRVQILEAGLQNVLRLTCEAGKGPAEDISILVPRGKLREAVALEIYWNDNLLTDPPGWLRSAPQRPSL